MNIIEKLKSLMMTQAMKQPNYPTKIDFTRYDFTDDEKEKFEEFLVLNGLNLNDLEKELEEFKNKIEKIQYSIITIKKLLMTTNQIEKIKQEIVDYVESIGKNNSNTKKEK